MKYKRKKAELDFIKMKKSQIRLYQNEIGLLFKRCC